MDHVLDNPFENIAWPFCKIDLALVVTKKQERILVGTRHSILAQLKSKNSSSNSVRNPSSANDFPADSRLESIAEKLNNIYDLVTKSLITNPFDAVKQNHLIQDLNAITTIPIIIDRSFEVGHFLTMFEYDPEGQWDQAIFLLKEALRPKSRHKAQWEQAAKSLLLLKWQSEDPICQYASLRIWQEYLRQSEAFLGDMKKLTRVFSIPPSPQPLSTGAKISSRDPILRLPSQIDSDEDIIHIWAPNSLRIQFAVMEDSFVPLKLYYKNQLNAFGQKFRVCSVCGKIFLTDTLKKKVCSDSCARKRTQVTKARYDEKYRNDNLETFAKAEYQYWYRRVNLARTTEGFPPDRLVQIEAAFSDYRKESLEQKNRARKSATPLKTFKAWAFAQEHIIVDLMGDYETRPRQRKPVG